VAHGPGFFDRRSPAALSHPERHHFPGGATAIGDGVTQVPIRLSTAFSFGGHNLLFLFVRFSFSPTVVPMDHSNH
jgi:hypothetical protein